MPIRVITSQSMVLSGEGARVRDHPQEVRQPFLHFSVCSRGAFSLQREANRGRVEVAQEQLRSGVWGGEGEVSGSKCTV